MSRKRQSVDFKKNAFEKAAWERQKSIIGVDEVGRGCLAGPVVTAAVTLPIGKTSTMLKDSKLLSAQEREKAYYWILKNCQYSVGIVHHRKIDRVNIWHATLLAMKRAVIQLLLSRNLDPEAVLIDAMPLNLSDSSFKDIPIHHFPFGEKKSSSIAAASIVAKVTRDRLMHLIDPSFPFYSLARHKGYSTREHKYAIMQHGHSIIHRMSYLDTLYAEEQEPNHGEQQAIW